MTIKVGDKLAIKAYSTYCIYTVIKILPSGRIKAQRDGHPIFISVLNPDLSVRGERGTKRMQRITPDIENEIERHRLLQCIEKGFMRRNTLPLVQVQSLHQWMTDAGLLTD